MADHQELEPMFGRRKLLKSAVGAAGAVMGLSAAPDGMAESLFDVNGSAAKLRVVVAGAHPDDPESGCGGTVARYADLGHEVFLPLSDSW